MACISLQVAGMICFWHLKTEILLSTTLSQLLMKRASPVLWIKHVDMYYKCQCSAPFLSWLNFSCFSDVFYVFEKCASVCLQLWKCHPSSPCRIHPLVTAPWTWKMKNGLCSACRVVKCLCSIKCKCTGWITVPFESGHLGNYLYLYGDAFGNVIQLEPEPSIRKAGELKYKLHTIWHKPVATQETWT